MTTLTARSAAAPAERVVVVAGGTGFVGGFVVQALLATGARVVVPTRRPQLVADPASPEPSGPEQRLRLVHVRSWEDPVEVRAVTGQDGWRPDAVVAAVGGWWIGTELTDLSPAAWRELVETNLTGHFLVARSLLPLIAEAADPVYLALNGVASREPLALSGPVSVTGAAQRMLLDVLRAETLGRAVRIHELVVLAAVAGDARNLTPERTVTGAAVAQAALQVLADPATPPTVEVGGP